MENILKLLSSALTPVIALTTTYIAIQQYLINKRKVESDWRLAQSKQRFDLYERRLSVFNGVMDLIGFAQNMPVERRVPPEPLFTFRKAISESFFLFEQDITDYLRVLEAKYNQYVYFHERASSSSLPDGAKSEKLIDEALVLEGWFGDQFEEAPKKFSKYLSLRELEQSL